MNAAPLLSEFAISASCMLSRNTTPPAFGIRCMLPLTRLPACPFSVFIHHICSHSAPPLLALNCLCSVLPEPGFSWLLSRIITLLDGYGPQVGRLSCFCFRFCSVDSIGLCNSVVISAAQRSSLRVDTTCVCSHACAETGGEV